MGQVNWVEFFSFDHDVIIALIILGFSSLVLGWRFYRSNLFQPHEHTEQGRKQKQKQHEAMLDHVVAAANKLPPENRNTFILAEAYKTAAKAFADNPNNHTIATLGGPADLGDMMSKLTAGTQVVKNSGVAETIGSAIRGPEKPATPVTPAPAATAPMKPAPKK